ncbi:5'-methylthioadenosine/adenosylhomocysteine nucleosidase [Limnohabitans sp.]|jgi:adenosylhomocysteine nucleosidase|uniref:5'-methylthioadenosine/adenosylhomocysteine nucleosidase n=1 Tax=Limnohabitans sp. TaxID=1907725 RepID=UPI0037BFA2CB
MAVIGIMSAMHEELAAVLAEMPDEQRVTVAGRDFWVGHWQGHSVVAVLSRIGKVAAATTATLLLERFQVDTMVFTGVAGGLGPGVRVGDVVVASGFVQHDMDASPLFARHEVPLYGRARFDAHADLSAQLANASVQVLHAAERHLGRDTLTQFQLNAPRVHEGLVISGDRFVSTRAESQALRLALPEALAVEMEGAAVAQVCHDYQAPFAAVRTISDRADDMAHADFNRFIREVASRYSLAILSQWLADRQPG